MASKTSKQGRAAFRLHPRLAADAAHIGDWPLCALLRMNDRTYPWLVLVPRRARAREITDLAPADRARLMAEIDRLARQLKARTGADKLNIAALGNVVPQLHVHVIARFRSDPAWPKPVWGLAPSLPFPPDALAREVAAWRAALDLPERGGRAPARGHGEAPSRRAPSPAERQRQPRSRSK